MTSDSDPEFHAVINGGLIEGYDELVPSSDDDEEDDNKNGASDPVTSEVQNIFANNDDDSLLRDDEHFYEDEIRDEDAEEIKKVTLFRMETCGCKQSSDGTPCSENFSKEQFMRYRADFLELTREERDVYILSMLRSQLRVEDKNERFSPQMNGFKVCMVTFLHLNGLGKHQFYNILSYYRQSQTIAPRVHGNSNRLPSNAIKLVDIIMVKNFLLNYAEDHAIHLPGSWPNFRNFRVMVLDCSKTKASVYNVYRSAACLADRRVVSYPKFNQLWNQLVPFIVIGRPKTDLCEKCQRNNTLIGRTVNKDDSIKLKRLIEQEEHILRSERGRFLYKSQCQKARESQKDLPRDMLESLYNTECSFDGVAHISFDYAQQLHYPSNPEQPGPVYFLTPRKAGLFGISDEGRLRQINYIIDEGLFIGKGANTIISLLHHYCKKYSLGEKWLDSHADNCVGQNKNNFLIWYLLWRILTGRHKKITFNFMIAGHTKFSCDRCFGLIKKTTRRTFISSLSDIQDCIIDSSPNKLTNKAELVGLENGHQFIQYYDWKTYLSQYFKTLPEIIKYHHFEFSSEFRKGDVVCRVYDDSPPVTYNILKSLPSKDSFPVPIRPKGLSKKRKDYLAKEIRPFCKEEMKYTVAPLRQHELNN